MFEKLWRSIKSALGAILLLLGILSLLISYDDIFGWIVAAGFGGLGWYLIKCKPQNINNSSHLEKSSNLKVKGVNNNLANCKACDCTVSKKAKTCPNYGAKNKQSITTGKIIFAFLGFIFMVGMITGNSKTQTVTQPSSLTKEMSSKTTLETTAPHLLETSSWSCTTKGKYMYLEGEVKNISIQPIRNLMAVATFRTDDGTFVKSDDAVVDYNPLMPGQISPFKVMSPNNPAVKKCRLSFKTMMGGKIKHRDLKNENK